MQVPVDLKSTVNLPKTDFPMKANLPRTEPLALERWDKHDVYGQLRRQREGAPLLWLPTARDGLGTHFPIKIEEAVASERAKLNQEPASE